MEYTYKYPKADLTVDVVAFGIDSAYNLMVAMIRRGEAPFIRCLALPGGFVDLNNNETTMEAAHRELYEETGIQISHLEQLYTFDDPHRDPRGRVISVAYMALVRTDDYQMTAGSDASAAMWLPVSEVNLSELAFDHATVLTTALTRLRNKIRYVPIGFNLLPETFTLTDLRRLYEAILGHPLEVHNFRKRVLQLDAKIQAEIDQPLLEPAGTEHAGTALRTGPPAKLYRFNKQAYELATKSGINFEL